MTEYLIKGTTLTNMANAIRSKTGSAGLLTPDSMVEEINNMSAGVTLGFNIVGGTTQPANPTENTIWANTDISITNWSFNATTPSDPQPGMLWFVMNTTSNVSLNALKTNEIQIYPSKVLQYVDNEWVEVETKAFINNNWVDCIESTILFANGQDNTSLTGGWISSAYSAASGYVAIQIPVEITDTGVAATLDSSKTYSSTFIGTSNMINVTDYTTLKLSFSVASCSANGTGAIAVKLYSDAGYTTASSADVIEATSGTVHTDITIDVSSLTGNYYIGYFMWKWSASCIVSAKLSSAVLI